MPESKPDAAISGPVHFLTAPDGTILGVEPVEEPEALHAPTTVTPITDGPAAEGDAPD